MAVILFEILSGRAPFEAKTPLAMAMKHATEPSPDIIEINPKLPKALGNVMKKVLQKDRDKRYRTCVEFINAFLEALPESSKSPNGNATPLPSWIYKHTEAPTELPSQTTLSSPQTRSRIRLGIEFVLVALLGVAIWGYPRFNATADASTSTPQPVTATTAPATPTKDPPAPTITPTETVEPTPVPAVPSVGGAVNIAFTSNRDVYLMDMDGKNITQLTNTNISKFDLQWLPDGREILYAEGKCVYKVDVENTEAVPEEIACFTDQYFEGFRVSPDGTHVAISIGRRLLILPFDLELLATAKTAVELQKSEKLCIDYSEVTVKSSQWSSDGKSLAILYRGAVGNLNRLGEAVRILNVNLIRCEAVDPVLIDQFPGRHFTPDGYAANPVLPSYHWDGNGQFVFNTYIRNGGYGELYLYDMDTQAAERINPVNGICCYRSATLSPDGTYILFAFQDIGEGFNSRTKLYYVPLDVSESVTPLSLPLGYFANPREDILIALRPPTQ